jgi:hypothetical protein
MFECSGWNSWLRRQSRHALILALLFVHSGCRSGVTAESAQAATPAPQAPPAQLPAAQAPVAQAPRNGPGPEWSESGRARQFVGADLFNHIDGGAELFLELGFNQLTVRRFTDGKATLAQEVYEMKDPTAARGIYLRFRGKGLPVTGVHGRNVGGRYQIIAQKDRYFVQLTSASGDERLVPAMSDLVNNALASIPNDGNVALLDLLPAEGLVPNSEAIVCGPYSLQSVFTLGEGDILDLNGERCGIAGDYETEQDGGFTRMIVAYGRPEIASAALQHLLQGLDQQLEIIRRDASMVVFHDSEGRFGSVSVADDKLDLRLHLVRDPGAANPPE